MNPKKIKRITFIITIIILEIISIFIGAAFHALKYISDSGWEISGDIFQSIYLSFILSPFSTVKDMISEPNPLYIMLALGSIFLAGYMVFADKSKTYQVESQYAVHGSQRWATYSEIVKPKQIIAVKPKIMYSFLIDSIESDKVEEEEEAYYAQR